MHRCCSAFFELSVAFGFGDRQGQGARSELSPSALAGLHTGLRAFRNTYRSLKRGPVHIVEESDPLLVEEGLAIYLWHPDSPSLGYKLAAANCEHYDARYGNGPNGPSCDRLAEIFDFIRCREGREAE
jgi:hypothetical protein